MQRALIFAAPPSLFPVQPAAAGDINRSLSTLPCKPFSGLKVRAVSPAPQDSSSSVDYDSPFSVFPSEACETVGGDACDPSMYPEAKLKPEANSSSSGKTSSETVDREYMDYDGPKTVFVEEACDDLGGEFCEPEYKR